MRLTDGSVVGIKFENKDNPTISDLGSMLSNGPNSVGGEASLRAGFRHFAGQWWIPTTTGLVPVTQVVEVLNV